MWGVYTLNTRDGAGLSCIWPRSSGLQALPYVHRMGGGCTSLPPPKIYACMYGDRYVHLYRKCLPTTSKWLHPNTKMAMSPIPTPLPGCQETQGQHPREVEAQLVPPSQERWGDLGLACLSKLQVVHL